MWTIDEKKEISKMVTEVCVKSEVTESKEDAHTAPYLGPDAEIVENAAGGKQSELNYRFDLIDGHAMFRLAEILDYGAKRYGDNNWRNIPQSQHINHALTHIYAHLMGDTQDDHLGHAMCRMMMAVAKEERDG